MRGVKTQFTPILVCNAYFVFNSVDLPLNGGFILFESPAKQQSTTIYSILDSKAAAINSNITISLNNAADSNSPEINDPLVGSPTSSTLSGIQMPAS